MTNLLDSLSNHLRGTYQRPAAAQPAATAAPIRPVGARTPPQAPAPAVAPAAGGIRPVGRAAAPRPAAAVDPFDGRIRQSARQLPAGLITRALEAQDETPERMRFGTSKDWVHASSLKDICPRQFALARQMDMPLYEAVRGPQRVMWELGRAVERHIRAQLIRGRARRGFYGRWRCLCKASEVRGFYASGTQCQHCNQPLDQYHELTLFDAEHKVSGNPDLIFEFDTVLVPLEIKSISAKQWDELAEPKADHVLQVALYHHLLRVEGLRAHDQGVVVYCVKDYKFGSVYKEFHVDFSSERVRRMVATALAEAATLRQHEDAGTLPPRVLCQTAQMTRAKRCPLVGQCFNREG